MTVEIHAKLITLLAEVDELKSKELRQIRKAAPPTYAAKRRQSTPMRKERSLPGGSANG